MKAFMILGAIVGFLVGAGFSLAASSPWPTALWRACAAALGAAVLARWWSGIWLNNLKDALRQPRGAHPHPSISNKQPGKV